MSKARDKFVHLAESRTNKLLKDIALLSNLSNRTNYSYTEQDVEKIFKAIKLALKGCEQRFEIAQKTSRKHDFKL